MPQPEPGARRRSIRLPGYDYSQPGAYFVTICTQDRRCVLGDIVDGEMHLNPTGRTVDETWQWLARRYTHLDLDRWVVMPNHLHAILHIVPHVGAGFPCPSGSPCPNEGGPSTGAGGPRPYETASLQKPTLGQIVAYFKYQSTKKINARRETPFSRLWQRNYYEHIIRNDDELDQIRRYIIDNPSRWMLDRENPDRAEPP